MDYYKLKVLNNKKRILIILLVVFVTSGLLFYYFCFYKKSINNDEIVISNDNMNNNVEKIINDDSIIWVDIKGYVSKPGVYSFKLSDNARINDLILKAGGLKKEADTSIINLSKKLEDEMSVIIYSKKEIENYVNTKDKLKNELEICEIKLENKSCIKEEVKNEKNMININSASKNELMNLQGIGESKAQGIIDYRKKNPFKTIEELKNVEGIGESLFESIKNNITV